MRLLLDTHVWLWMLTEPERLGQHRDILEDPGNSVLLSAASTWELAIKVSIGRLTLPDPVDDYVATRMQRLGVTPLGISHTHAAAVAELPIYHRDPFDRLLVAQAKVEKVPLLTADRQLLAYDIDVVHVR